MTVNVQIKTRSYGQVICPPVIDLVPLLVTTASHIQMVQRFGCGSEHVNFTDTVVISPLSVTPPDGDVGEIRTLNLEA